MKHKYFKHSTHTVTVLPAFIGSKLPIMHDTEFQFLWFMRPPSTRLQPLALSCMSIIPRSHSSLLAAHRSTMPALWSPPQQDAPPFSFKVLLVSSFLCISSVRVEVGAGSIPHRPEYRIVQVHGGSKVNSCCTHFLRPP